MPRRPSRRGERSGNETVRIDGRDFLSRLGSAGFAVSLGTTRDVFHPARLSPMGFATSDLRVRQVRCAEARLSPAPRIYGLTGSVSRVSRDDAHGSASRSSAISSPIVPRILAMAKPIRSDDASNPTTPGTIQIITPDAIS